MFLTYPDIHLVNSLPIMLSVYSKLVFFFNKQPNQKPYFGFCFYAHFSGSRFFSLCFDKHFFALYTMALPSFSDFRCSTVKVKRTIL